MSKNRIEKEDIISDEAINNVKRLQFEIKKLSNILNSFAEEYNIDKKDVIKTLKTIDIHENS